MRIFNFIISLMVIPLVMIYLIGQRYLVKGLTAGALKGE